MELSELGGGVSKREVWRHEAAALAEERPEEAEAAFLKAGAADDAVRVWLARGHHQRALELAEQHAHHMVEEVLVEGARAAAERGDLAQFETLMIRANRPREVVQHYKDLELWEEASRVSREYLPDSGEPVPPTVPPLLQRAADHADRGEWWEAVELLVEASAAGAAGGAARLAERAALRAARLARDRLSPQRRANAAHMLADRFAAIGQSDIGEQLRAALTEGYSGDDEATGASSQPEYEEEDGASVQLRGGEGEGEGSGSSSSTDSALEKLARAGHWQRCLAHAGHRATHYALRYAAHLLKAHSRTEAIDIESEEVPEALSQILEMLRQYLITDEPGAETVVSSSDAPLAKAVTTELLLRVSTVPKSLTALKDAAAVMLAAGADDRAMQAITLLMALHVPQIAPRVARALPRYTDIIVADVAYYVCGMAVRGEGNSGSREAFVLLNRCLDLVEAAEDDAAHLLDYTDFECTDWARNPLLLESGCVRGAALDEAREWVLAVSMDQAVEQTLPVDSRGMYAASVPPEEPCCVLTGHPLGSRLVTFTNGRCANREWWSRASSAARGGGAAAALIQHIGLWCGPGDYSQL